jgi:hypothetical protein
MSIHLVPERMRWNPSGIDELAVETALALLRDASVPVAAEPIGTTPMAVLLAQHQRLRRFGRDALQPEAVTMLRSALTDLHPDVRALVDDLAPSTLPPMLSTSLDAALGRTPDASRARSRELLAGIAGQRLAGGPWLRWDATDLYELKAFEGMVEMPEDAAPPSLAVARLAELLRSAATIRRTSMLQVAREMSAAEMAERLGTSPEFVDGALSLALGLQGFATAVQPGGTTVNPRLNGA